ncbi:hypothetical protein GGH91_004941, partial [Coemansia sp. RSA 2671]
VATVLGASSVTAFAIATPVFADSATKKSIYDDQPREFPATNTQPPTRIIAFLREARHEATTALSMVRIHGQMLVDRWIHTEQQVADVVRRTVPRGEALAPGIIYVGVAALAGPIFTGRRNFVVRGLSPLVFGAAAAAWFLPGTSAVVLRNVWGRYGDPAAIDRMCETWQSVKAAERQMRKRVAANVQELRLSLQQGRGFGQDAPVAKAVEVKQVEKVAEIVPEVKEPPVQTEEQLVKTKEPQAKAEARPAQLPLGFKSKA